MSRAIRDRIAVDRVAKRARREVKHVRLRLRPARQADHPLLHVIGCQRSGTTMLTELLDRDRNVRVHGELGRLFDDLPHHHRMKDVAEVQRQLRRSGAALDVVKPLVESHRCHELLALHDRGVALWMFRHYGDVAASNLRRFGIDNGRRNLRAIVDDDPDDWRNAGVTPDLRATVRSLYAEDMPPHDAAALFWYCRNSLFSQQRLDADPRVRTCQYERLVADPASVLAALYTWLGMGGPGSGAAGIVHRRSVGNGRDIEFGSAVRRLGDEMWASLVEVDRSRSVVARSPA